MSISTSDGKQTMQLKKYRDGTHRSHTPEQTLEKINPFLKDMGITRVANLTGLDDIGIPVIGVSRPNSKSLATSQGKGHSVNAAKASGMMESIEGFHAENIDLKTVTESYKNLNHKIDISRLAMSCEREFSEDIIIPWVRCLRIDNEDTVWLPYELIHADFTVPVPDNHGYFIADSNGLASGNTILEAINHGLYEVIERDCLALWQLTPHELHHEKRVNLDTINDEFLNNIINKLKQKNIHVGIWNITSDACIPTFICKILSDNNTGIRPAYGSGTHLNKNIALSRAITEAAQSRVTFIAGARDDQYHEIYENEISDGVYSLWLDELRTVNNKPIECFESIPMIDFETLEDDRDYVIAQLSKIGLKDAYYANLTKQEFNIPVVKVVVPGLEGVTYPDRRLLGERGVKFYDQYGVGACEMK